MPNLSLSQPAARYQVGSGGEAIARCHPGDRGRAGTWHLRMPWAGHFLRPPPSDKQAAPSSLCLRFDFAHEECLTGWISWPIG